MAPNPVAIIADAPPEYKDVGRDIAAGLLEGGWRLGDVNSAMAENAPILLVGTTPQVAEALNRAGLPSPPDQLGARGTARVWMARYRGDIPLLVVEGNDIDALRQTTGAIRHYGANSYLVFDGGKLSTAAFGCRHRGPCRWISKINVFTRHQSIRRLALSAWTFLVLTMGVVMAPFLPISHATAKDGWTSQHFQDHPLAGTIWTLDFEAVTISELEKALANARFVLLGEIHDNPDHHRLQARLIDTLVGKGRRPAIVFEMIPANLQAELDRHVQGGVSEARTLGKALRWEERGWPDWAIYQPIAKAALSAALPLKAGGLGADVQKVLAKGEASPIYTQTMEDLDLARPLKPEAAEAEALEIKQGHCNLLPAAAVEPMMKMQRALDASLAKATVSANAADGAVLIAGAGHVRNDWLFRISSVRNCPMPPWSRLPSSRWTRSAPRRQST